MGELTSAGSSLSRAVEEHVHHLPLINYLRWGFDLGEWEQSLAGPWDKYAGIYWSSQWLRGRSVMWVRLGVTGTGGSRDALQTARKQPSWLSYHVCVRLFLGLIYFPSRNLEKTIQSLFWVSALCPLDIRVVFHGKKIFWLFIHSLLEGHLYLW